MIYTKEYLNEMGFEKAHELFKEYLSLDTKGQRDRGLSFNFRNNFLDIFGGEYNAVRKNITNKEEYIKLYNERKEVQNDISELLGQVSTLTRRYCEIDHTLKTNYEI